MVAVPGPQVKLAGVRSAALEVEEVLAALDDPAAGGVALFIGRVRDQDDGRKVTGLDYEAHPSADAVLTAVASEVAAAHPVHGVAVLHRDGALRVGDLAVIVGAAGAHRDEVFVAVRELTEAVKSRAPIWKHQCFADGTSEWVGSP